MIFCSEILGLCKCCCPQQWIQLYSYMSWKVCTGLLKSKWKKLAMIKSKGLTWTYLMRYANKEAMANNLNTQ